jgi:heme-degrading monooxygenase HmoA
MSGRWRVKAGQEDAFVRAWEELAMWSSMNVDGTGAARLLQSADDPGLFVGLWEFGGPGAIRDWRAAPEVRTRLEALGALLDDAEPGEFELRAAVGD